MNDAGWKQTILAPERTHHLLTGEPLYKRRFDWVQKFHAPGLAPVGDTSGSYHIDMHAEPAYGERHHRAFGFYEGRAAVDTAEGWRHILVDGSPLYDRRYQWCGNYQGGRCTVRLSNRRYGHLTLDGTPAYEGTYRYAGDFRDGVAVVQNDDGLHSHIDVDGRLLHGRWFDDLDVFHKDFARARDVRGWHHINSAGEPLYTRRFAEVEAFYNGQARVKGFDGGLEVVNEQGDLLVMLREAQTTPLQALSMDMVGFWKTQTIQAAVELGVFNALPENIAMTAKHIGLSEQYARRLLHGLWELELVHPDGAERWCVTPRGALLCCDAPSAMGSASMVWARDHYRQWQRLPEVLRGEAISEKSYFEGLSIAQLQNYQHAISGYARHDYEPLPEVIDWREHNHVVDAGGGQGVLLAQLLAAHSHLRGTLLELPQVVETVDIPDDLFGRFQALRADFFEPWPVEADGIVLARVLHDWPDVDVLRILRRARQSLRPGGKLYIIEMILAEGEPNGSLLDLNMLVMTGGRERTRSDWARLLDEAGFEILKTLRLPAVSDILVGGLKCSN